MKCHSTNCNKEAAPQNGKWCSRECAPFGHFSAESRSRFEKKMGTSTTMNVGGVSIASSLNDKERPINEKMTLTREKDPSIIKEWPTNEIERPLLLKGELGENLNRSLGGKTNPRKEYSATDEAWNKNDKKHEPTMQNTEMTVLPLSSINIEEARLDTISLLDESTKLLRDLMNTNKTKPMIVCHLASEMHKLIRLKLDIIRTAARTN